MYQAAIFSFKVSQNFIVYESAEDRNLRAIFNRVKKKIYLAIFLPDSIATRMPYLQYFYQIALQLECLTYLPKMNSFPWTACLPEGLENGIIQKVLDQRL